MPMKSSPILVLGIGGTGLKAATFILKGVMEANNNAIPPGFAVLVADTEANIRYSAGGWGQARGQHHATGPVAISTGDYIPLTGKVKELGEKIRDEQRSVAADPSLRRRQAHRHISTWFQAEHYIHEAVIPDEVWNLDIGAGQYPQFGRLGLFNHVTGHVETLLTSAIGSIKSSGVDNFQVHIIGSFAGGTGAGLYVDFPHLIREIATQAGFKQSPTIIGHFALAEAFRGTSQVNLSKEGTKQAFSARTYASLRQLTRLQGQSLPNAGGYPLIYDPNASGMLNAKLKESPYTYSYLYDGQRQRNAVNSLEIEDGLAPSIADVVLAYADGHSGPDFKSHTVNFKAYYGSHNIPTGQVTYGSVGAYTIELPIYHITEGWSHHLAKEVLDIVLAPQISPTGEITLDIARPGGTELDPRKEARTWLEQGQVTNLLRKLVQWGRQNRNDAETKNTVQEILGNDAEDWLKDIAPTDARFAAHVAQAQDDLHGSFKDKENHYFVNHDQGGNNSESRAANLIEAVDQQMTAMVGAQEGVWLRTGGGFYRSLVPLADYHRQIFEKELLVKLAGILNGTGGSSQERKQGKLGFGRAWLKSLEDDMQAVINILTAAKEKAAKSRSDDFKTLEDELKTRQSSMQHRSGLANHNLKSYRDKANDLAQFHKADIARKVVHNLVERLVKSLHELGDELDRWINSIATATSTYGGAYHLLLDSIRDIEQDRQRSKNAARWVIDDTDKREVKPGEFKEELNSYIKGKRDGYLGNSLDNLLDGVAWTVEQTAEKEFRVQFATYGQNWDRHAGGRGEEAAGRKNLDNLLRRCRAVFEPAWETMSVTEYLHYNYENKENQLAQKVYDNSGYLLGLHGLNEPPMRTTYMRVFKEGMEHNHTQFLNAMLTQIRLLFNDTTTAQQRDAAVRQARGEYAAGLLNADGQDSYDRFKLTYLMFGDLLQPHQIAGYANAQQSYRNFSRAGQKWKTLHILPAETNALAVELDMDNSQNSGAGEQRRRELNEEVVAVLEDMDRFQLAMRCLAYGEEAFPWDAGDRGLLLHKHTPRENNEGGNSYWRLTVAGHHLAAAPTHYQLSNPATNPDLWEAILQLVVVGKGKEKGNTIDMQRVEATVAHAQTIHRSRLVQADKLTWQPNKKYRYDTQFKEEGLDKAAQVIRLNSLIAEIDKKLESGTVEYGGEDGKVKTIEWQWVWRKRAEGAQIAAPEGMNQDVQKAVIRNVDLYTALRWAANDERKRLSSRLFDLGQWSTGKAPSDKISLYDLPKGWICPEGHHNVLANEFCTECGKPQKLSDSSESLPLPEEGADEPPRIPTEMQEQLDALKKLLEAGILTQAEYDAKVTVLQEPAINPEMQEQLDALKKLLEAGILTQAEYDAKVMVLQGGSIDPEIQKKLDALKEALEVGAITQDMYDDKVKQLHEE